MCVTHCSCQGNCRKISTDERTYPRSSTTTDDKPITPGNSDGCTPQTVSSPLWPEQFVGDKQPPAHADCHSSCENTLPQIPKSGTALSPPRKGNNILLPFTSHPVASMGEEQNTHPSPPPEFLHPESRRQLISVPWTSGCCATSEMSEMGPEGVCIAESNCSRRGDFIAHAKPSPHFGVHQLS